MATILMEPPLTPVSASAKTPSEDAAEVKCLVAQAQGGSMSAFDALVERYQERIYGLCYHLTSNHEEAADLAQDAFVKAWQALATFKGDASFFTWVYRIAVNTTLNYLKTRRRKTPHISLNDLDFNAEHDPELVALVSDRTPRRDLRLREIQERLNAGLQKLSEEHRAVLVLHDIQGLAHEEIARLVGCNPGTVRSRLFYARQQMQAWLADLRD